MIDKPADVLYKNHVITFQSQDGLCEAVVKNRQGIVVHHVVKCVSWYTAQACAEHLIDQDAFKYCSCTAVLLH